MINVSINGVSYPIPETGDELWGDDVTTWIVAASSGLLQRSGGSFTLLADVDFGSSFGLVAPYLKSKTSNIAQSGVIRLATTDAIAFRNATNAADLLLNLSGNVLQFNGNSLLTAVGALTANRAVVTNGTGAFTSSATTSTELGYVSGLTSAAQTQLNAKQGLSSDLTALAGLATTGLIARTASGTAATRTITGTSNRVTVTNGDGVSGNPTLDIGTDVVTLTGTQSLTNKTLTTPAVNGILFSVSVPAYSATITILSTDNVKRITATSGAVTATLPTGVAGQTLTIVKTDSSFNVVTINDAAAAAVTTLNTQGEAVNLIYDGSSWTIQNRYIPSTWTSVTVTNSNSTANTVTAFMKRIGDSAVFDIRNLYSGPNTQGAVSYAFPVTFDTAKMTTLVSATAVARFGTGTISIASGRDYVAVIGYQATSSLRVAVMQSNTTNIDASLMNTSAGVPAAITTGSYVQFTTIPIPITGWNG